MRNTIVDITTPPIQWSGTNTVRHPITIPTPSIVPSLPTRSFTEFWNDLLRGGWKKQTPQALIRQAMFNGMAASSWSNLAYDNNMQSQINRFMSSMSSHGQSVAGYWMPE